MEKENQIISREEEILKKINSLSRQLKKLNNK